MKTISNHLKAVLIFNYHLTDDFCNIDNIFVQFTHSQRGKTELKAKKEETKNWQVMSHP